MKLVGNATLAAPRKQVWDALQDPAVLVRVIPGCERLETIGDDTYRMTVSMGVAAIKGLYQGEVQLSEPEPHERFVLKARGQGAPGTVEATVQVRLSDADGGTRVDYDADAVVGGMIGGVGQRMLTSVARKTAGEFFAAVERDITGAGPGTAVAPAGQQEVAGAVQPAVYGRPLTAQVSSKPMWAMLAAFSAGAGIALGSAVIGWMLGRRSR